MFPLPSLSLLRPSPPRPEKTILAKVALATLATLRLRHASLGSHGGLAFHSLVIGLDAMDVFYRDAFFRRGEWYDGMAFCGRGVLVDVFAVDVDCVGEKGAAAVA